MNMENIADSLYSGPEYLESYFNSRPSLQDNVVGKHVRSCIVNKLKMTVDGKVRYPWIMETTYQKVFFPDIAALEGQEDICAPCGLPEAQWKSDAVPFI